MFCKFYHLVHDDNASVISAKTSQVNELESLVLLIHSIEDLKGKLNLEVFDLRVPLMLGQSKVAGDLGELDHLGLVKFIFDIIVLENPFLFSDALWYLDPREVSAKPRFQFEEFEDDVGRPHRTRGPCVLCLVLVICGSMYLLLGLQIALGCYFHFFRILNRLFLDRAGCLLSFLSRLDLDLSHRHDPTVSNLQFGGLVLEVNHEVLFSLDFCVRIVCLRDNRGADVL